MHLVVSPTLPHIQIAHTSFIYQLLPDILSLGTL